MKENGRRFFLKTVWAGVLLFNLPPLVAPEKAYAIAGMGNMIETRILWVESRTLSSLQRLKAFFSVKNAGIDFYRAPVIPPEPPQPLSAPVGPPLSLTDITRAAHEGMGAAVGGISRTPGEEAIGNGIHQMAYEASPQGALRLGADTEGHIYQMLLSIHKDLLYLLKEQSSSLGLEGEAIEQTRKRSALDQMRVQTEIPSWIMIR